MSTPSNGSSRIIPSSRRADQAGWHGSRQLRVPENVTLIPLPPYAPELNPVERVWLHLRERFLSHHLLNSNGAIVDACCHAWNQPPRGGPGGMLVEHGAG
ncbi:transposase [Roseomonas sp. GCM10028921]